ncbi:MAG: hypothetical protein M3318_01500, partial [Actinomycetota bacterium]|nr:hypothetical protein [Actinomycetota bacterium]
FLLRNLRDDRNGGQGEHRQKRRQQHQLLQLYPSLRESFHGRCVFFHQYTLLSIPEVQFFSAFLKEA